MKKIKNKRKVTKKDVYVKVESVEDALEIRVILEAAEEVVDESNPYNPQNTYLMFDDVDNDWFYSWSNSGRKITIPQLAELLGVEYPLKSKFKKGVWYRVEDGSLYAIIRFSGELVGGNYGINFSGDWTDVFNMVLWDGQTYKEATASEVERALIAEAKRRYEVGDRVSQVNCYNMGSMYGEEPWVYKGVDDWLVQDDNFFNENLCLMRNGEWAEVIEQKQLPTLEELIAEAKSKITVRPESYPCWVEGTRGIEVYRIGSTKYMTEKLAIIGYITERLREEYL